MSIKIVPLGWYTLAACVSRITVVPAAPKRLVAQLDAALGAQGAKPRVVVCA